MLISLDKLYNDEEATLRVGELSRRTGKTVRALRLYEECGLLEPAKRSSGGFRLYSGGAVIRVRWISQLQELGFTLQEIRLVLKGWEQQDSAPAAMSEVTELYQQKLTETRERIANLRALEAELASSLEYLQTCETCHPEKLVESCSRCDVHESDQYLPELVAGFHTH